MPKIITLRTNGELGRQESFITASSPSSARRHFNFMSTPTMSPR
jgi:hypothetical protein